MKYLKKLLGIDEDDHLTTSLTIDNMEGAREDGDPTHFTLELLLGQAIIAEVHGEMYFDFEADMPMSGFVEFMDSQSYDQGAAGFMVNEYLKRSGCSDARPGTVLYIYHIDLYHSERTDPSARGVLLEMVSDLFYSCTGNMPGIVTMILAEDEDDIKDTVENFRLISHPEIGTVYVHCHYVIDEEF